MGVIEAIWNTALLSLRRVNKVSNVNFSTNTKVKRIFKIISFSFGGLVVLVGIVVGIWYYFDEVRPKQIAENIYNTEIDNLNKFEGKALLNKCKEIIIDHNIKNCGDGWLDESNIQKLSDHAWEKIESLAYSNSAEAQYMLGLRYGVYNFITGRYLVEKVRAGA